MHAVCCSILFYLDKWTSSYSNYYYCNKDENYRKIKKIKNKSWNRAAFQMKIEKRREK